MPSTTLAEQRLEENQQTEDTRRFGHRPIPADVAVLPEEAREVPSIPSYNHEPVAMNEYDFDSSSRMPDTPPISTEPEANSTITPSAIDWNSAPSAFEAWLNTSAMPMEEPASSGKDEFELEAQRLRTELHDLQSL